MSEAETTTDFVARMARLALGQEVAPRDTVPEVDWQQALDLTFREGLAALIYAGTRASGAEIPMEVAGQLRAAYLGAVLREETWLEPGLELIMGTLQDAGLEPVVLKGAALAFTAYPHPALRSMGDIDLMLPPSQVVKAYQLLLERGFQQMQVCEEASHHLPLLQSADGQLRVELHHSPILESSPYKMDAAEMRSRCARAQIGSTQTVVLGAADALHMACVHLAYSHRYRWFPLRTSVDILALTGCADRAVDWNLFVDSAKRWRTAGATYWPLMLSRRLLGAAVPRDVLSSLAPPQPLERLFDAVLRPEYLLGVLAPGGAKALVYNRVMSLSLLAGCPLRTQGLRALASLRRTIPTHGPLRDLVPMSGCDSRRSAAAQLDLR